MDQVKQFLWQVGRYRFWISVCVAALLSAGAYVLGSGPVQKATEDEAGKISSAYKDVQQYASSSVPTADFAPIVQAKTEVLTKDVDAAWKSCYERQAPLLTWPETVADRFSKWGRKWPEDVADTAVNIAIIDYIEAYPAYVDSVFKVFRPFDYETGEGVVASAPKDQLLRVVAFDVNKPPKLNEVWSAQERLWVQRTVLEVIADVNRDAKDWDSASVKEIKALEVGSSVAQDQRSLAKGEELEEAEPIVAPDEPEEEEAEAGMGGMEGMMGMYAGKMAGAAGGPGAGTGGKIETAESVFYLKPENATQYKILPVMVTVLVDQDRVPDLLVAFENSPMSIEVRDFELQRPTDKVTKPEKGDMFMGGYGGMMGMGMMPGMRGGRMGYGGMSGAMMARGRMMGEMGGMEGMGMMNPGMMRGMGNMGPMGAMGGMSQRKGTDKRGVDRAEKRKEAEKALEASKPEASFDAYYNIVEVTVYGQARFYNEPTPAAAEEASPGEASAEATEEPQAEGAMPAEEPKADPAQAPAAEEPKADPAAPAEEPKADPAAQPEEPKADPAAPAEAPKAEEPKADPAEAPKADPAPAEAPKAEAPAPAEAPKAEAPPQP